VDLGCLGYIEMVGSGYPSHYSFSCNLGDYLHSVEHTLEHEEVVVVVKEVEEAWNIGLLVLVGL